MGIGYLWLGRELGGMRDYEAHMGTALFRAGVDRLLAAAREARLACMCAERSPEHCHRNRLSDALARDGVEVLHILGKDEILPHAVQERSPASDRQTEFF